MAITNQPALYARRNGLEIIREDSGFALLFDSWEEIWSIAGPFESDSESDDVSALSSKEEGLTALDQIAAKYRKTSEFEERSKTWTAGKTEFNYFRMFHNLINGIILLLAALALFGLLAAERKPEIRSENGISTRIENREIILRIDGDDFGMDSACARSVAEALIQSADELDELGR